MELEQGRGMLHLEVEAQYQAPPRGARAKRTRLIALGSATLLLAGAAVLQTGGLAPRRAAGAARLVAVGGVPQQAQIDAMRAHRTFHPDPEAAAAKAGTFARDETMELTCENIPVGLGVALADAEAIFHRNCDEAEQSSGRWPWSRTRTFRYCSFGEDVPESEGQALDETAKKIMEHAWAADTRGCLEETMADEVVQDHVRRIKARWLEVLEGASSSRVAGWDGQETPSVRERFEKSHADIDLWREQMLAGADTILDQHLIFPRNVDDPNFCPAPCIHCTREHHSLFEESEDLSFKCVLPNHIHPPELEDLNCTEPAPRHSLQGQIRGEWKTWCDVRSWHVARNQSIALGADVKCGAEAILGPLHHGIEMEESVREACQSVERGQHTEALDAQHYHEFVVIDDGVATPADNAAFRVFMELGMAEGLADLRRATHGNTVASVVR